MRSLNTCIHHPDDRQQMAQALLRTAPRGPGGPAALGSSPGFFPQRSWFRLRPWPVSSRPTKAFPSPAGVGEDLLPHCHRVASLLKRWMIGTHQGAISHEHLDYYLDEYTFRFNRRTSRHRGKLFYRLVQQAVAIEPTSYKDMVNNVRGPRPRKYAI